MALLSSDSVVITGSHDLGYQASYNNDENLMIVRGHQPLARAYAVNIMDIYDHDHFRYVMQENGKRAFSGIEKPASGRGNILTPKIRLGRTCGFGLSMGPSRWVMIGLVTLTGCSHWTKDGTWNEKQYRLDAYACARDAGLVGVALGMEPSDELYRQCMTARGYTQTAR